MDNTVGSLTQFQKSLIEGTILGDGYIRTIEGRADAFLEVNHSIHQKEYVDWKYQVLEPIVKSAPKTRRGNGDRIAYRFFTQQLPYLSLMQDRFYYRKKKIIPSNLDLTPMKLAVWYMDDGSKCRSSDVYLNTQQFDYSDQKKLITKLSELGLEARLNKDKQYYRIRFLKSSVPKLFRTIQPHMTESMSYKLS